MCFLLVHGFRFIKIQGNTIRGDIPKHWFLTRHWGFHQKPFFQIKPYSNWMNISKIYDVDQ